MGKFSLTYACYIVINSANANAILEYVAIMQYFLQYFQCFYSRGPILCITSCFLLLVYLKKEEHNSGFWVKHAQLVVKIPDTTWSE